jgi:hypothetical protein
VQFCYPRDRLHHDRVQCPEGCSSHAPRTLSCRKTRHSNTAEPAYMSTLSMWYGDGFG